MAPIFNSGHGDLIKDDVNTISVMSLYRTNCPAFFHTSSLLLMHVVEAYDIRTILYRIIHWTTFLGLYIYKGHINAMR